MNVALPAVVLFLLVAPGFIYHHFSQAREVREADMTPFGTTVLKSIGFAVVFNAAVGVVATKCFEYQLYLGDAVRILSGAATANSVPAERYRWLNEHPWPVLFYFAATFSSAFAVALTRQKLVERFRLDRPSSKFFPGYFRQQAPWYYLFSGSDVLDDPAGVAVSAIVSMKDATYLYTGLLVDYEVKDDGELDRIVLSNASRRKLADDRDENHATAHERDFYPIDGDRLIIRSTEWTTLNVKFLKVEAEQEETAS